MKELEQFAMLKDYVPPGKRKALKAAAAKKEAEEKEKLEEDKKSGDSKSSSPRKTPEKSRPAPPVKKALSKSPSKPGMAKAVTVTNNR